MFYQAFFYIFVGIVIGLFLGWVTFLGLMKYAMEINRLAFRDRHGVWYPRTPPNKRVYSDAGESVASSEVVNTSAETSSKTETKPAQRG